MCGITGFISPNYQLTDLKKMTTALKHRGPDAEGFFWDDQKKIGLGHRRLSIIDLSDAANQPFYSQDGRYAIVFNGEVYNFQEIKSDLQKEKNIAFKTNGDTEAIIEAFAHWGLDAVYRFNGMFAIALWDRQKEELLLVRDRIGIKPLYYYFDGINFAFASELKALLELPFLPEINMEALKDYFFLEYVPAPNSIIKGIKKLEKGHYLKVDPKHLKLESKTYYSLVDQLSPQKKAIKKEEEYAEELNSKLEDSLKRRSISDVPIGAFLSGGTDSSLISTTFQKLFDQPINTFTIGFDVPDFDESEFAKQVSDHIGSKHFFSRITDKDSISIVEKIVDYYDEPFAVPSTLPSLMVCQRAKENVTVALGGDGGDEIFMGYGHYNWMNRIQKIRQYGGGG
jgi:asparagine synthase (glutamine-hydrolysing)